MQKTSFSIPLVALCALCLMACDGSTAPEYDPPLQPAPPAQTTAVNLEVGNGYLWQHAVIRAGFFVFWNTTTSIPRDSTIANRRYAALSTGELLRSSHDTVYAWVNGSEVIWYRLNVSVGDTVPFIGHRFLVTEVRTQPVFGDTQRTVTVVNSSISHGTNIAYGHYASKFGILLLQHHVGLNDTTTSLLGARIDGREYGIYP